MARELVRELRAAIDSAERVTQLDGVQARLFAAGFLLSADEWQKLSAAASEKRRVLLAAEAEKYREGSRG